MRQEREEVPPFEFGPFGQQLTHLMWKMCSIFHEIRVPMFFFDTQVGMYVHYLLVRKYIQMLAEANVENITF